MFYYDKDEIKNLLTPDMVFDCIQDCGGSPRKTPFGFISATICHNRIGEGSHKLYYYENTRLFRCYTGCDATFDIFELITKIHQINHPEDKDWTLYSSVCWVAQKFHFAPSSTTQEQGKSLPEWELFEKYQQAQKVDDPQQVVVLPEFDKQVLYHLPRPIIPDWLDEGMTQEAINHHLIGYYAPTEQLTIPHFDVSDRFVGLRGRALGEDATAFGKYRPMMINGKMYNHPLGLNLYNINQAKTAIKKLKKAIVFEGEKSCILYESYFGQDNDISVACCGSSISNYQIKLLMECGAEEIIIAFDRQFKVRGDDEFKHLTKNLAAINKRYRPYALISFIFDKTDLLPYKSAPIDQGKEIFLKMYKERIIL